MSQDSILDSLRNMGGTLDEFVALDDKMMKLMNKINELAPETTVSLVCGMTGTGKSTLLSYLYDPSSLLIDEESSSSEGDDTEDEDEDEEKKTQKEDVDEEKKTQKRDFTINGRLVEKDQWKFYKKHGWVILDSEKFRVGYNLESATLLPNYGVIDVEKEKLVCFDLAGFADNRGFAIKVVIDAMLAYILRRFTFRRLVCLCSANLFTERSNTNNVITLKGTLESCGLVDILQLVIVRYTEKKKKKKKKKTPSYQMWLKNARRNVKPKFEKNSVMLEEAKISYEFFSKHIENALFMSYLSYAKESREDILKTALTGDVIKPQEPLYTFSPDTKQMIVSLFEKLNALLLTDTANELLSFPKSISAKEKELVAAIKKVDELKGKISTIEKNIELQEVYLVDLPNLLNKHKDNLSYAQKIEKDLEVIIENIRKAVNSTDREVTSCRKDLEEGKKKIEVLKGQQEKASKELEQLITSGSESIDLSCERMKVYTSKEFFVTSNCDDIVVSSHNNDNFVTSGKTQSNDKSSITVENKNLIYSADISVTFRGRRYYTQSYQNNLAQTRRTVDNVEEKLKRSGDRVKALEEELSRKERKLIELRLFLAAEETKLLNLKDINLKKPSLETLKIQEETQIRETISRYRNELTDNTEEFEKVSSEIDKRKNIISGLHGNWAEKKKTYFNNVLKHIYRIKNSEMFKYELQSSQTNNDLRKNFETMVKKGKFANELKSYCSELGKRLQSQ